MNKTKACLIIFMIIILIGSSIIKPSVAISSNNVEKDVKATGDPILIGSSSTSSATWYAFQRAVFYASGRFWVFYDTGESGYVVYKSSTNGSTWSSATQLTYDYWGDSRIFSVYWDGTYVHYVHTDYDETKVFYRRGTPLSNGTIVWDSEVVVSSNETDVTKYCGHVTVDSNGYPWITYTYVSASGQEVRVIKANTTDGSLWNAEETIAPGNREATTILSLSNGRVYVIYVFDNELKGRLFNGTGWEPVDNISSTTLTVGGYRTWSAVSANDKIHVVYYTSDGLIYRCWDNGTWSNEEILESSAGGASIAVDTTTNDVYVFYSISGQMYVKRCIDGVWQNKKSVFGSTAVTVTANIQAFMYVQNNTIGVVWTEGSDPWDVKFALYAFKDLEYVLDMDNDKLYVKFFYKFNNETIPNADLAFYGIYATTNASGWAVFDLSTLAECPFNSEVYEVADPIWKKPVLYHKVKIDIFVIRSTNQVSNLFWDSTIKKLSFKVSASKVIVYVDGHGTPSEVRVNDVVWSNWTYNDVKKEVTVEITGSTIELYWPPSEGGGGGGGGGITPGTPSTPTVPKPEVPETNLMTLGIIMIIIIIVGAMIYSDVKRESLSEKWRKKRGKSVGVKWPRSKSKNVKWKKKKNWLE